MPLLELEALQFTWSKSSASPVMNLSPCLEYPRFVGHQSSPSSQSSISLATAGPWTGIEDPWKPSGYPIG
jgi:hypothetical protein